MASIIKHPRKDGKTSYRIYYFDHQNKRRSKIVIGNKKKAESIAHRIEIEVQDIKTGLKPSPSDKESIGKLVDKYLKHIQGAGKQPSTIIRYKTSLTAFTDYFTSEKGIGKVTYAVIENFKSHRLKTCTPSSVNVDLRHLRGFLNHCVRMGVITESPYRGVKQVKVGEHIVRFLREAEIHSLLFEIHQGQDEDIMDLIQFYLHTGARANEILPPNFTWESVKKDYIELYGKGEKTRRIGLNDTIRKILHKRRDLEFPFPFKYEYVYSRIVKKYYKRAGIKNANLHTLRKTAGALLIQQGVDIYRVSRFLGHSSVVVTERHYLDLLQKEYSDMTAALENAIPRISEGEPEGECSVAS